MALITALFSPSWAGMEAVGSFLYMLIIVSCNYEIRLRPAWHTVTVISASVLFFLIYRPVEILYSNYTAYLMFLLIGTMIFTRFVLHGTFLNECGFIVATGFVVVVLKSILIPLASIITGVDVLHSGPWYASLWYLTYYLLLAACGWFLIRFAPSVRLPKRYWLISSLCIFTVTAIATLSGTMFGANDGLMLAFNLVVFWLVSLNYVRPILPSLNCSTMLK